MPMQTLLNKKLIYKTNQTDIGIGNLRWKNVDEKEGERTSRGATRYRREQKIKLIKLDEVQLITLLFLAVSLMKTFLSFPDI